MRCWPWTCSLCHIAQLSAALLPDPSSCLAFRSEVEYRIRNSWDLGLVFPISFLCDVMGNRSSSCCDSCSLPITSKATRLTLTVPSKQKNLFHSTGRSKKQNKTLLSCTWNNLDGLEIVHVWSFQAIPSFLLWCYWRFDPPPVQHTSIPVCQLGPLDTRQIYSQKLLANLSE